MDGWDDKPRDECGVFGLYVPGQAAARLTFHGLNALQHRGQESAGIASSNGRTVHIHKAMGLVTEVFSEDTLRALPGHLAAGHTRYSTTGDSRLCNAQPYLVETSCGPLAVAHNGNLTNTAQLRRHLLQQGVELSSTSDTEVIAQALAAPVTGRPALSANGPDSDPWLWRLRAFMRIARGAYSLVLLTRNAIYAIRDPLGIRPLCLGQLGKDGHVAASESCALQTVDATYLRQVEPGEIVRLDRNGMHSFTGLSSRRSAFCAFEYVYFAHVDSILGAETTVHEVRQQLGRQLACEAPATADVVIGVPQSAIPHAIGYSAASDLPYREGLTRNRFVGRTFIQPSDELRQRGVALKYSVLRPVVEGKRVVLVNDSIVRGNTMEALVHLLQEGGATEVHVRVASPPIRHPCFMGIDIATHEELIAHDQSVEDVRQHTEADSLAYLSLAGLQHVLNDAAASPAAEDHCLACFSGRYPLLLADESNGVPHASYQLEQARTYVG